MIQEERPLPGGLFFETWIGDDSMETIRGKIQKILEETVNLQLAAHNGSASLSDFADGVASLLLIHLLIPQIFLVNPYD